MTAWAAGEPSPHPCKGSHNGPNKWEGAPPAEPECPCPGTKGFLILLTSCSNLSLQLLCRRNNMRCPGFEIGWETGQRGGAFYWL